MTFRFTCFEDPLTFFVSFNNRFVLPSTTSIIMVQCLKVMVAQSPLATKNWAGPVKFDPGQLNIIIDYIRREIFWTFLGD